MSSHFRLAETLITWRNFGLVYTYILTKKIKDLVRRHKNVLLSDDIKKRYNIDEEEIFTSKTFLEFDEVYTSKVKGFNSVQEFYKSQSCVNYMRNGKLAVVYINALNDPLVPLPLLNPVRKLAGMQNSIKKPVKHNY